MVLADFVCGKSLLPDSQVELFSYKPHIKKVGMGAFSGLFYEGTNLIHEGPTLMT